LGTRGEKDLIDILKEERKDPTIMEWRKTKVAKRGNFEG